MHFVLKVFSAFVFFFAGWLYFDSWKVERRKGVFFHFFGFILLAAAQMIFAVHIASPVPPYLTQVIKVVGLVLVVTAIFAEPKVNFPKLESLVVIPLFIISPSLTPLIVALYLVAALATFKRIRVDYDKQLKLVAVAFLFLALSEIVNLSFFWGDTTNVFWSNLLSNFNFFWILARALSATGSLILGIWVWGYVRFRPRVQLFAVFSSASLTIFLATTVLFTGLLLRNLEIDALGHLVTDIKVLQLRIDGLKLESVANARAFAADKNVETAIVENQISELDDFATEALASYQASFLDVISENGGILSKATDLTERSQSFLEDPLFEEAIEGEVSSGVTLREGALAPIVNVKAVSPITGVVEEENQIIAAVSTGYVLDSAFVDGVKESTGLDATIYGNDQITATTLVNSEGGRDIGIKIDNQEILQTVYEEGNIFTGKTRVLNEPFYATYSPLRNPENEIVGSLFIGRPQTSLVDTASRSIELTFYGSALLIAISIIPSYLIAKYINDNLGA